MMFTLAELTKIKLEPGEVLSVKLFGDDYEVEDVQGLKQNLEKIFPANKVLMFVLPNGSDLQMEVLSGSLENKEVKELEHEVQKAELLEKLNAFNQKAKDFEEQKKLALEEKLGLNNCSVSYCQDCSCGKKQAAEAQNDVTEPGSGSTT